MSNIQFIRCPLHDAPEAQDLVDAYHSELERRQMPSTWPKTDLLPQASLIYNDLPVSIVLFAEFKLEKGCEDEKNVYIAGAYTLPSWRRCGLYGDLFDIMVNEWRKEGDFDWVKSGFHLNNQESRTMQERQGREFYEIKNGYQRTRLSLRPTGQEYELTQQTLQPILDKLDRLSF